MSVIVGIPAYNEEKNIASIITKLKKITDKIIVCDDGSEDLTSQISKDLGAQVITHEKNMGYGAAIRSLFLKAKELECDVLVTFDADGQHRIEDIEKVIKPISENESDIVIGSRFLDDSDKEVPSYRKVGIKVITKITNASIKKQLTDSQSGFRAYSKQVLTKLSPSELGMGISTEILIKASSHEFRITEVPIKILYGENTSTHNPVSHGSSVLLSTIKFTSIEHPLKFYGIPSIVFLIIGISFTVWTIQEYAISGDIITNVAIIAIGCVIVGVVLLLCAILLYSLVSVMREGKN
ncbi:MAG: glycosyl transferase [Chloroflexi bacterium]|nr:glycosyl transferase [Chloroflexota bacterium]|tara:strand:+ start:955 stop:1839 length:885 start_codon:yes stop_codon:yes gene_type:complete